jgi:hypothetical protein
VRCSGVRATGRRFHARRVREISHPREDLGVESEQLNGEAIVAITATSAAELTSESPRSSTAPSQRRPRATFLRRQNSSATPKRSRVSNALPFSCKGRYVMIDSTTAGAARRPLLV